MDVWFCESRNHRREAHLRTVGFSMLNVRALPSTLADSCALPLTKTYMEVGNAEVEASSRSQHGVDMQGRAEPPVNQETRAN
jgi:hypothetical protein